MSYWADVIFVLIVVLNLGLLSSSRLGNCIRLVAIEGALLGLLPLLLQGGQPEGRTFVFALGSILVKGIILPLMLNWAVREANIFREVEPFIGYTVSMVIGVVLLIVSFWISARLVLPIEVSRLAVSTALFTILVGLFLIVSRKKAITQALSYLVMENGIFIFGTMAVALETSFMGIIIFHINRQFEHIDMDQLASLKDWHGTRHSEERT